jgi:hypothetical protein
MIFAGEIFRHYPRSGYLLMGELNLKRVTLACLSVNFAIEGDPWMVSNGE